ncbi:heme-binding protein [Georgenia sp. SUBG003]|uniref:heme-binding protein n=1 Tax=Georgenia sp. SUBG003 TaxID=1497974 RepID=UPI003AB9129B
MASRLDPATYAAHGGVFPLVLRRGGALLGAVGVSGLPQREDHAFVVEQLRAFLAA